MNSARLVRAFFVRIPIGVRNFHPPWLVRQILLASDMSLVCQTVRIAAHDRHATLKARVWHTKPRVS